MTPPDPHTGTTILAGRLKIVADVVQSGAIMSGLHLVYPAPTFDEGCALYAADLREAAALIAAAPAMYEALKAGSDALHNAVLALALQLSPDHEDVYAGSKALAVMEAALRLAQGDGGGDE